METFMGHTEAEEPKGEDEEVWRTKTKKYSLIFLRNSRTVIRKARKSELKRF